MLLLISSPIRKCLGNKHIHKKTNDGQSYSLRVDLVYYEGEKVYALYNTFSVESETNGYRLRVGGYDPSSTIGERKQQHIAFWHTYYVPLVNFV